VHAADGNEQKQNHEQNQQHGARRGPARPPQQIGKEHRDQAGEQQRAGIKDEQPPAARDARTGATEMVGASAMVEEVFQKMDDAREHDSTLFPKRPFAGMREPEQKMSSSPQKASTQ
jgi:hypothetical protein